MIITFLEYDFPCKLFDFNTEQEIAFENYRKLEKYIQEQLLSTDIFQIKDGLSNVLYWGYYRIGYGKTRLHKFRKNVSNQQLQAFASIIKTNQADPFSIKKLGMPQFSGLSFISKILMFIDPTNYVVLDKKIMELRDPDNPDNPLSRIPYTKRDSGIRISQKSNKCYLEWCELCYFIADKLSDNKIAVDIERNFFKLVEENKIDYGRCIITSEIKYLHALTGRYMQLPLRSATIL